MTRLKLHSEPLQEAWLDDYGHLNEAYYLVPFSTATWALQDRHGIGLDYFKETGVAIYTVETHLRYLAEVRAPAYLEIETLVIGADAKRIWYAHEMHCDGVLRATAEFMVLHYNTRESRTTPMPEHVQESLQKDVLATPPDWASRSLSLVKT